MSILNRVEALLNKGHDKEIEILVDKLEKKAELNPDLQEKLDALGDTPVAEPKIFEAINKSKTDGKIVIAKAVLTAKEVDMYTGIEVGDFIYAVEKKITLAQNEDGTFKSTPKTENCKLPNFFEVDELMKLGEKQDACRKAIRDAKTDADRKKAIDKFTKATKEIDKKSFEISGLDIDELSDWEKSLVASMVYISAINASLSSVGKPSIV